MADGVGVLVSLAVLMVSCPCRNFSASLPVKVMAQKVVILVSFYKCVVRYSPLWAMMGYFSMISLKNRL